jgi:hypothetical protein
MSDQVIIELGAEGGSLTLMGNLAVDEADSFWLNAYDCSFNTLPDENVPPSTTVSSRVSTWDDAMALLDAYPYWTKFYPLAIHPDFKEKLFVELCLREEPERVEEWMRAVNSCL